LKIFVALKIYDFGASKSKHRNLRFVALEHGMFGAEEITFSAASKFVEF